jgi:hypothetical protein
MKKRNENCLEGMRCPKCKALEPFDISVLCTAKVFDDGTEETHDMEWDDTNACSCPACGFQGLVRDFKRRVERVTCPKAGKCAAARHGLCDHAEPHTKRHFCGKYGCPVCVPAGVRKNRRATSHDHA